MKTEEGRVREERKKEDAEARDKGIQYIRGIETQRKRQRG